MDAFHVGDRVQAIDEITENNFLGQESWVHARPDELGHVMGVDGEWATVTWRRTGTTTDCHSTEIKRTRVGSDVSASFCQIPDPRS